MNETTPSAGLVLPSPQTRNNPIPFPCSRITLSRRAASSHTSGSRPPCCSVATPHSPPWPRAVSRLRVGSQPATFHAEHRSQPARLGDQTDYREGHAAPLLSPAAAVVGVFTVSIVHSHSPRLPGEPHNRLAVLSPPSCRLPIRCCNLRYHKVE